MIECTSWKKNCASIIDEATKTIGFIKTRSKTKNAQLISKAIVKTAEETSAMY